MRLPPPSAPDNVGRVLRRDVTMTTAALLLLNGTFVAASALSAPASQPDAPDMEDEAPARGPGKGKTKLPDTEVPRPDIAASLPVAEPFDDAGYGASSSVGSGSGGRGYAAAEVDLDLSDLFDSDDGGWFSGMRGGNSAGGQAGHAANFGSSSSSVFHEAASGPKPTGSETYERPMTVRLGSDGNDVIQGNSDNDYIFGRDGDDLLTGGEGNDRLMGGKGKDVLLGGLGRDILVGDKGDDTLSGGLGSDTFVFRSGFGHDLIVDFNANREHDVIDIAKSDFANFAALSASLTDTPYGAMLTLPDGSTLTLSHVAKSSLTASDFYFEG